MLSASFQVSARLGHHRNSVKWPSFWSRLFQRMPSVLCGVGDVHGPTRARSRVMKLTTSIKRAALAVSVAMGVASAGCSRDHIEAVNLANEGDRAVAVNVEGAIQKYEQARQLDPTNHLITWKLAKAYEKKEDWDKMAATLSVAANQAPSFANYWEKRGFALTKLAEA